MNYFVPDCLGGYQKEKRVYFITNREIIKILKKPELKRIGSKRSTFIFHNLP